MRRVLFVDDEPNVLNGMRRMLSGRREDWRMTFAGGGPEALDLLRRTPFDVIVSDMRMPGMDGAALLESVRREFPRMLRLILTGQPGDETTLNSSGVAHNYLYKPCDPAKLQMIVERAFALKDNLQDPATRRLVMGFARRPTLPPWHGELVSALGQHGVPTERVAEILGRDETAARRIVEIVNRPCFSPRNPVATLTQALGVLGHRVAKALFLAVHLLAEYPVEGEGRLAARAVRLHSHNVADQARTLARHVRRMKLMDEAFISGLLHDVGRLALLANLPDDYIRVLKTAREKRLPFWKAEQEAFGTTHAAVGALIASEWEFPERILEVTAFHHEPARCVTLEFDSLTAVHVADALDCERAEGEFSDPETLDREYLARIKMAGHEEEWRALCKSARARKRK
jgi:HD-like signal output (HDOD) protein